MRTGGTMLNFLIGKLDRVGFIGMHLIEEGSEEGSIVRS